MARPARSGLDYFPLDTDFDCDDRIRYLRKYGGDVACFQYLMILKEVYRVGFCYRADEVGLEGLSELLRIPPEEFRRILDLILKAKLLDPSVLSEAGYLTSKGIQRRYFKVLGDRKVSQVKMPSGVLLIDRSEIPKSISLVSDPSNTEKEIEKEKESKGKGFGITPDSSGLIPINSEESPYGTKRIVLDQNQYTTLLVNHYHGDEALLREHIEHGDAHCMSKGISYQGERAVGFLRKWKIKSMEFSQHRPGRKSRAEQIRDSDEEWVAQRQAARGQNE